jgi:hypothetical protein
MSETRGAHDRVDANALDRGRLCRPSGKAWLRPHPGGAKRGAAEIPFNAAQERDGTVKALPADLGDKPALAKIEAILQGDPSIAMLVNNAGTASVAPLLSADVDKMDEMIALNVTALTRLTYAVAPAFVARGAGTIINIASIGAISPETLNGVYGRPKPLSSRSAIAAARTRRQGRSHPGGAAGRDCGRPLGNCRSPLLEATPRDRDVDGGYGRCGAGRVRPRRTGDDPSPPGWRRMDPFRGCAPRRLAASRQLGSTAPISEKPSAKIRVSRALGQPTNPWLA